MFSRETIKIKINSIRPTKTDFIKNLLTMNQNPASVFHPRNVPRFSDASPPHFFVDFSRAADVGRANIHLETSCALLPYIHPQQPSVLLQERHQWPLSYIARPQQLAEHPGANVIKLFTVVSYKFS
jgi:hypothetical protein